MPETGACQAGNASGNAFRGLPGNAWETPCENRMAKPRKRTGNAGKRHRERLGNAGGPYRGPTLPAVGRTTFE